MALYAVSAILAIQALWMAGKSIRRAGKNYLAEMPYVFILAIFLLPLVSHPIFFIYDLSIWLLGGILIYEQDLLQKSSLKRDILIGWLAIDLY